MQEKHSRRPFLTRPFWRDWVLCGVLIGAGFVLLDATVFRHDLQGRVAEGLAIALLGGGASVLLAAIFHAVFQVGARVICGDSVLSGTELKRFLKPAIIAAGLFVICWWVAVALAFPLVVVALGFTLREGWAFLLAKPTFAAVFLGFPLIAIPINFFQAVKVYLRVRRTPPPRTS
jgi:hypothetical protein